MGAGLVETGGVGGASHVNLKQDTNPGGFLFLCRAKPCCHLFFPSLGGTLHADLPPVAA